MEYRMLPRQMNLLRKHFTHRIILVLCNNVGIAIGQFNQAGTRKETLALSLSHRQYTVREAEGFTVRQQRRAVRKVQYVTHRSREGG